MLKASKKLGRRALLISKQFTGHLLIADVRSSFIHKKVPYFSQWESRDLNADILNHTIEAKGDPSWEQSGAKTKEEYAAWSWSGCGMACTKMVLVYKTGKVVPLVMLGKKCAEYGGYMYPLESSVGLLHAPYVKFLRAEYGITARLSPAMTIQEVIKELNQEHFIIVSVSPQIREPHSQPKVKGGHLVLLVGYDLAAKQLFLHNPSGNSTKSQEYAAISFTDFKKFFVNRGIVIV